MKLLKQSPDTPLINYWNRCAFLDNVDHVFRLLTYIDGSKLNDSEPSSQLYNNVGELVGKIYLELKVQFIPQPLVKFNLGAVVHENIEAVWGLR